MGKVVNPRKRANKGRLTPLTPNQTPCSERGQRRSQKTEQYQANKTDRGQQSYGHRTRGGGGAGGKQPLKGPSKRPSGVSNERWRAYMEGRSAQL